MAWRGGFAEGEQTSSALPLACTPKIDPLLYVLKLPEIRSSINKQKAVKFAFVC